MKKENKVDLKNEVTIKVECFHTYGDVIVCRNMNDPYGAINYDVVTVYVNDEEVLEQTSFDYDKGSDEYGYCYISGDKLIEKVIEYVQEQDVVFDLISQKHPEVSEDEIIEFLYDTDNFIITKY